MTHSSISQRKTHTRHRGFRLQPRDVAVVDAVYRHRVLSTPQIGALFFPTASGVVSSRCRARLRHLVEAGYLARAEVPTTRREGRRPYLYLLARAGRDLLLSEVGYDPAEFDWEPGRNQPGAPFLAHQLDINHVYVALARAAAPLDWEVAVWVDDRQLRKTHTAQVAVTGPSGGRRRVVVVPDAYGELVLADRALPFFLEVDRGTMTVASSSDRSASWRDKIRGYERFVTSEAIQDLYGTDRIRVLTVTTSPARMQHLMEATADVVGADGRYWFATMDTVRVSQPLTEPIWQVLSTKQPHPFLPPA